MSNEDQPEVVRPNRRVFLWRPIVRRAVILFLLALAAHFFLPLFAAVDPGLGVWLGGAAVLVVGTGLNRFVAYRQTFYRLYDDRLVVETGTIATRHTIDLPYRNVTQVVLRLPFLERRFFGTGHLRVHAAGSARGVAHLQSIDEPRAMYDAIADRLRENGFSLARNRRLQREKPHLVGTVLDTSGMVIGGLIALITVGLTVGGAVIDTLDLANYYELFDVLIGAVEVDDPGEAALAVRGTVGLALLAVLAGTAGLAKVAIHFVDLNRRTYTLWDDVVDYEDGFLTETYKFIPIENLADTATEEPFLKRLFGMADVELSPHGSASGIRFPSMPRANQFRGHLDELIESSEGVQRPSAATAKGVAEADDTTDVATEAAGERTSAVERRLPDIDAAPLQFSPSLLRRSISGIVDALRLPFTIAVALAVGYAAVEITGFDVDHLELPLDQISVEWVVETLLLLTAVLIVYHLGKAVFYRWTTNYRVGRRKVTWERDFVSRDEFEFTNDKITSVTVERDITDRLLNTATISFRSIGNATPLVFEDAPRAREKVAEIRRRLGLFADDDKADAVHTPLPGPLDLWWGRAVSTVFFLSFAAAFAYGSTHWPEAMYGAFVFAAFPPLIFLRDLIYYPRCRLKLFENYVEVRRGILLVEQHFVPYDQLRSVTTIRFPGSTAGVIQLVPGSSRRIGLRYVDGLVELHEELDDRLYARPMRPVRQPDRLDRTEVSRRQPMARNGIVVWSVFTLLAALVTVIPVVWLVLRARRTSIIVEQGRIRRVRGVLYRTTRTVLLNRVDQILTRQGPTHTLFDNGLVNILTVGSSVPELSLGPIGDGQALYDELETRLPGRNEA